jgi:3-mercaptopropionate dioxygenase
MYGLDDLIRDLTAVVERTDRDGERVKAAEDLVRQMMANRSWLPPDKQEGSSASYTRRSLYCDPQDRFEIVALVWRPGQRTDLHDHDGTWGVEGVYSGRLQVTNFLRTEERDGRVRLEPLGSMVVNEGGTGQLLPPADCHILESYGSDTAVTVHVYGKQLKRFLIFEPDGPDGWYRTRLREVGYSA